MKSLIIFIPFLFLAFAGCEQRHEEMEMNGDNENSKAIFAKMYDAFDNGDTASLDTLLSDDVEDHQIDTMITKKTGKEGVKELFAYFHDLFPDMKSEIHTIAVSGDTVMGMATSTGTTSKEFMGMPANHKASIMGVDVVVIKDGKIVEHWGFIDPSAMSMPVNMEN